jgi:hypothetical protein
MVPFSLKGPWHEIFDLWFFFFTNQLPLSPWYIGESLFEYGFEFAMKINYKIADFHSGVNDNDVTKNDL